MFFFLFNHALDNSAGAETLSAKVDEILRILKGGYAAGGLYLYMSGALSAHKRHVLAGSATAAEAGGGLDELRTGLAYYAAKLDFFLLGEQAGLDDDLQQFITSGRLDGLYFFKHLVEASLADKAQIHHHIYLFRAVFDGVGGFKVLDRGGAVAVGKADNGADGQRALQKLRSCSDPGYRRLPADVRAECTVLQRIDHVYFRR